MELELELAIRKEYANNQKKIDFLKLWLENTLSEIAAHDDDVYSYKIRQKTIDSLLNKVRVSVENSTMKSFSDVAEHVDDIVGARIIKFDITKLINFNKFLVTFERFNIKEITVHMPEEADGIAERFRVVKSTTAENYGESCSIDLRTNKSGYESIHYVIEPKPVDTFYSKAGLIFPKFELQIKSLLQETWGEIEHKMIYKGPEEDDEKALLGSRFFEIADRLRSIDIRLGKISNLRQESTTFINLTDEQSKQEWSKRLSGIISELQAENDNTVRERIVANFETNIIDNKPVYEHLVTLLEDIRSEPLVASDIALYYMRAGRYSDAYEVYETLILQGDELGGFVYTRMAELCFNSTLHRSKGEKAINRLYDYIRSLEISVPTENQLLLLRSGSVWAWEWKLIDLAHDIGQMAYKYRYENYLTSTEKEKQVAEFARVISNLIHYKIDVVASEFENSDKGRRINTILEEVRALLIVFEDLKLETSASCNILHTLAYCYYWKANILLQQRERSSVLQSKELVERARNYIERCIEKAYLEDNEIDTLWEKDSKNIGLLKPQILSVLKKIGD